jgi:hypothetical protein
MDMLPAVRKMARAAQSQWVMLSIDDSSNNSHWIHDQLEISTQIMFGIIKMLRLYDK